MRKKKRYGKKNRADKEPFIFLANEKKKKNLPTHTQINRNR